MKIRSITCFCDPLDHDFLENLENFKNLVQTFRHTAEDLGWETQTARLATTPFGQYVKSQSAIEYAVSLEDKVQTKGFNYLSIGPARMTDLETYDLIPAILSATRNVFASAFISHPYRGISTQVLKACAKIIQAAAGISPDGFTNLRFCAMSHVKPFTPFFPAAYSYGSGCSFALAIEGADAAINIFNNADSINSAREQLLQLLNSAGEQLNHVAQLAARKFDVTFRGMDFSLAPFPEDACSIGKALELLGVSNLGDLGSLGCAAILADILEQGDWLRSGFNGLMMPVLEDSILAERSSSGHLTIKDLIMYSAVCGTGLDTVPLPGDIRIEEIESLLFDIAAQSLRLKKPLTARLMPVPGLQFNEMTHFDFDFFKNSRVMNFPAQKLEGLYKRSEWVKVKNRGYII